MTPKGRGVGGSTQIFCTHPLHKDEEAACTKTRQHSFPGGQPAAVQMLKHWAIMGLDLKSKDEHRRAWSIVVEQYHAETLPTLEALDRERFDEWPTEAPSKRPRPK